MTSDTPWAHLQRVFAAQSAFHAALPGLATHGLTGEDVGVLLNHPESELVSWMKRGCSDHLTLRAVEPPHGAQLPPRRTGARGLFGWLTGATAVEGVGLFTDTEVFEDRGVQFAVLPEPLRPVAYGELMPLQIIALNCTSIPRSLDVSLEAEPGLIQSPKHATIELDPGVICLARLPTRICPMTPAVVRLLPVFEADGEAASRRRYSFSARPYSRPMSDALALLIGVTAVAAVAGLSPVIITPRGVADQGSPEPMRLRPNLSAPVTAAEEAAGCWKLATLG